MNTQLPEYNWIEVSLVWDAYQNGKISLTKRDALLAPGRTKLAREMSNTSKLED